MRINVTATQDGVFIILLLFLTDHSPPVLLTALTHLVGFGVPDCEDNRERERVSRGNESRNNKLEMLVAWLYRVKEERPVKSSW